MVAPVAHHVGDADDAPVLKFLQAGRDVRSRDAERIGDFFGVERAWREVEQRVDLADRAVDPPPLAHLAPVEDELLHEGGQFHCDSPISVLTEITVSMAGGQVESFNCY